MHLCKPNYSAWSIEPIDPRTCSKKDLYIHLVEWAVLAASSHNVQPWRFILRPKSDTIDVCVTEAGILPASDENRRQAYMSVGCAAENLLRAADYYGLDARLEYQDEIYPSYAMRVQLGAYGEVSNNKDDIYLRAMKTRRMNRSKYDPLRRIPQGIVTAITETIKNFELEADMIFDESTRFQIAELQYTADKAAIARNDFRKELGLFLLPNDTDKGRAMPGFTFGLSDEMAMKVFEELSKEGIFDPDLAYGFAASDRDGIRSAPLLCVLSVESDIPEWWMKTGRALQKIALLAEISGVSMAVYAALVERDMFNSLLKLRLGRAQRPTAVFRLGYATEEREHSPRVPAEQVMEVEE